MADIRTGIDPTRVSTVAEFPIGTVVDDPRNGFTGNRIKYVQTSATVAAADALKLDVAATAANRHAVVTPTTAATSVIEGVAHVAIASGSFGWITRAGRVNCNVATPAAGDILVGTASAGRLGTSGATAAEANAIAAGQPCVTLVAAAGNRSDIIIG